MQQVRIAERYLLSRLAGRGGMGRVWVARDEVLHRDVAVKEVVLPESLTEDDRAALRRRTIREARAAAQLNHPNVVRVYDVVHADGNPWIVMEYVPSRSLQELLDADGPLDPRRTAELGLALLDALATVHRAGVLHRDVKPHNVLIGHDGRTVLTDFGLATFDDDSVTTRPGVVMGSPQYVAPERAAEGVSTVEADLWALGATLYAAVEGRSPYARSNPMATLAALATAPPDPTRLAGPLRPVLTGLLERDPTGRLTAAEAIRMLRAVRDSPRKATTERPAPEPAPTDPTGPAPAVPAGTDVRRPRRRTLLTVGLGVLLAAMTGSVLLVRPWDSRGADPTPLSAAPFDYSPSDGAPLRNAPLRTGDDGGPPADGSGPPPDDGGGAPSGPDDPGRRGGPGAPPAIGPPPFDCAPPPRRPPDRVTPAAVPRGERALPANWSWHTDPTGFRIAAPTGWEYFVHDGHVCFHEPRGTRLLVVDPFTPRTDDPSAYWRTREAQLRADPEVTGYTRIAIRPPDRARDAEWEFRWTGAGGERLHTRAMLITTAPAAYTLVWNTREFDWQSDLRYLDLIRRSFRPPTGRPGGS